MKFLMEESNQGQNQMNVKGRFYDQLEKSGELTIHTRSSYIDPSGMSENSKKEAQENAPSLYAIFEDTLKAKGEYPLSKCDHMNSNEILVKGMSQQTLHTFILEAQKLGKTIEYTKTVTVKISD